MTEAERKILLGNAGEKCIINYLSKKKLTLEYSIDPYDNQKDMKVNGKSLEAKTQVPFIYTEYGKCFTIADNHQLNKCLNVDILLFVQAPCSKCNEAGIYQVDKGFEYHRYITKKGEKMILIPMNQLAVRQLTSIEGKVKEILRKYATDF
jgi:hypothetical protein|tara:strand:- start:83 stop:532 length:450 start_codon:yes stop_codon:yes gene_type:complete